MSVLNKGQMVEIFLEKLQAVADNEFDNLSEEKKKLAKRAKKVSKKEVEEYLKFTFDAFESVLVEYQAGFQFGNAGKFEVVTVPERSARKGRNPQTGDEIDIAAVPAHLGFKFKPSKGKESVRTKLKNA